MFSYQVCYQQPLTRLLAVDNLVLDDTIPRSGGAVDECECEKTVVTLGEKGSEESRVNIRSIVLLHGGWQQRHTLLVSRVKGRRRMTEQRQTE